MCNDWGNNCTTLFWRCTLKAWNSTPLFWLWWHHLQGRAFCITKRQAFDWKTCNLNTFWQKTTRRKNPTIVTCFNLSQDQPVLILYILHEQWHWSASCKGKKLGKDVLKYIFYRLKSILVLKWENRLLTRMEKRHIIWERSVNSFSSVHPWNQWALVS